jgi:hypothetical protein
MRDAPAGRLLESRANQQGVRRPGERRPGGAHARTAAAFGPFNALWAGQRIQIRAVCLVKGKGHYCCGAPERRSVKFAACL